MELNHTNKTDSGFTVVELLAAVAIIVILLGISMVSVVRYRDLLKLTELDNAAREIYMAAENRAVLLSGARRLNSQLGPEDPASRFDYVSKAAVTEDLLPAGSIDPALRNGDFYIVYDRSSGSVTDVFYAESSLSALVASDFSAFYDKWAASRSDRLKLKNEKLVGWYNGEAAQGADIELDIPEEPTLKVMITNGEELTVTVEYTAPGLAGLSVKLGNLDLTDSTYDGRKTVNQDLTGSNGVSFRCTWVLDSLEKEEWKFSKLNSGVTPGDDITVTAVLTPRAGTSFTALSASETNNSIFQEGSGEDIAYIKYLRHLQNLDAGAYNSGVTGKTSAIQTADIRCKGNETYGDYDFIPIYNSRLTGYDGRTNKIQGLYVSGANDKFTGANAHAGLFSRTGGGTEAKGMTFKNIRLVNASVTAAGEYCAGALVGHTSDAVIQNCWVYWEPDGDVTDLKAVLGSDAEGAGYQYQITGASAGGLVGYSKGNCTITGSLAATLVNGAASAGGLIGTADSSPTAIKYSYADCYLTGGAKASVAGLIGQLNNGRNAALTNCYAAGYITGGNKAAGLCLGTGTTRAENAYSAMRSPGRELGNTFYFLTEMQAGDSFVNTRFLGKESDQISGTLKSTVYAEMTSDGFISTMGGAFARKTDDSHPYNLREHLTLNVYSFPGLASLPHYGDWGAEFKEPSLVYYERYSDNTWGVSGGNARDLIQQLSDNKRILSDGYAVVFLREDLNAAGIRIDYTYLDKAGTTQNTSLSYQKGELIPTQWQNDEGNSADYYMIPLPDGLVNSDYAQTCFYRCLKFELALGGEGEQPSGEYFYNPHFAETVVPVISDRGTEGGWTAETVTAYAGKLAGAMGEVKLRTPRHLYSLSEHREYYTRNSVFRQILDLDYAAYTGYSLFPGKGPYEQEPIGSLKEPFAGTYNGDCNTIKNVVPQVEEAAKRQYAGLFGYSEGTLRNIVYQMPGQDVSVNLGSTAQKLYVGTLAGGSAGTVDNCAVSGANLVAMASGVELYVGGLVGRNQGVVRNSAAEFEKLSADCFNFAQVYLGGLVGENGVSRSITASYAVGRVNVSVSTVKTARLCGFVGWNYGSITNSYAAVDLQSSGENVELFGFCGGKYGSQSGTGYLDQGNFTYRGASYAAKYHQDGDKAESVTYARLSGEDTDAPYVVSGMEKAQHSPQRTEEESSPLYPYPTAVQNKKGEYIHYGRWPEPMPLGEMGVFYWEKMVDADWQEELKNGVDPRAAGNPTYHLSALAVDPEKVADGKKGAITKQTTLSQVHNDGRVITDYGYGYYTKGDTVVNFKAANIAYTQYVDWEDPERAEKQYGWNNVKPKGEIALTNMDPNKITADTASKTKQDNAEDGLRSLMSGYTFHCWNSYHEGGRAAGDVSGESRQERDTAGLCLFKDVSTANGRSSELNPNSGTFTLTQGSTAVEFIINPQFADAMSVKHNGGLAVTGGASDGSCTPGTENNPYQVRCGTQLQEINWYDTVYTDVPIGYSSYPNATRFPYLSDSTHKRDYHWKQTHDMDWIAEGNTYTDGKDKDGNDIVCPGVFFSIAELYVTENSLPGWFGGTYDGGNYTVKNFNISINTNNYEVNCMGLFGAVQDAALKNIVMYSEEGTDAVTVWGRKGTGNNAWYAGGVLAGMALNSEISNCAVAGYTIKDVTRYAGTGSMGGAIGGLVGMTDKKLESCVAVTNIELIQTYTGNYKGNDSYTGYNHSGGGMDSPIRVGGLVGSTTAGVTNCYTGGEITVSNQAYSAKIYAGRLIGGLGMGVFGGEDKNAGASVSNCYSYLTLPVKGGAVQDIYEIGGRGRTTNNGTVNLSNNYYLAGKDGGENREQRAITYRQLAGWEDIYDKTYGNQSIYQMLNNKQNRNPPDCYAPYCPVTSEVGGLDMAGRYSYAPKNRLELQGMNYPFPTVLTQPQDPNKPDGGQYNVHYGGWTLQGIERDGGGSPVYLDLFTGPDHTETLKLSAGVPAGGTWSADPGGSPAVKASVTQGGKLAIAAEEASDVPVTVTVTYEAGGVEYSLPITVYVTANVELRPSAVRVFPNDTVRVTLTPYGLKAGGKDYVALAGVLSDLAVSALAPPFSAEVPEPAEGELPFLTLARTDGPLTGEQVRLLVSYTYTQDGYTVIRGQGNGNPPMEIIPLDLPAGAWDKNDGTWSISFEGYELKDLAAELPDGGLAGFEAGVSGSVVSLKRVEPGAAFPADGVKLNITLTLDGLPHTLTVTVPPKPEEGEGT